MRPINVLVVDDSAFMRRAISKMLEGEQDIVVCATARCGEECV
ncbi:MAG: chemotaxis response regulator protein-glutamate methylesterase, partial [Vulcanimicrobiaceae bacterium]